LLNGRTFETLEHLNEVTASWLQTIADERLLRSRIWAKGAGAAVRVRGGRAAIPGSRQVVYRHVGVDGYLAHRSNLNSVPFSHIGQVLPVRITESEVIIYSVRLEENHAASPRASHPDRRAATDQSPSSGGRSSLCPQAASLWYKIIDARSQRASTALVTNIDFESWATYLGDAPLAMALLDRVVDGATIVKLKGKSYRMHRGPGTSDAS
jgi:hypothetical protein